MASASRTKAPKKKEGGGVAVAPKPKTPKAPKPKPEPKTIINGLDLTRQGSFVPDRLRKHPIVIVGCGTTGSWALQVLAREGFSNLTVFDPDEVESHNLPGQAFRWKPKPGKKVLAAQDLLKACGADPSKMKFHAMRLATDEPQLEAPDIAKLAGAMFILCVDSAKARVDVSELAAALGSPFMDIRMGVESGSVIYVPPMDPEVYRKSLNPAGGFAPEPACGARAIPSTAFTLVGHAIGRWIAAERVGSSLPKRVEINVAAGMIHEVED